MIGRFRTGIVCIGDGIFWTHFGNGDAEFFVKLLLGLGKHGHNFVFEFFHQTLTLEMFDSEKFNVAVCWYLI